MEKLIDILMSTDENNPVSMNELVRRTGIDERFVRKEINEELMLKYSIGSCSNSPGGYFFIRTSEGLKRANLEDYSRINSLLKKIDCREKSFYNKVQKVDNQKKYADEQLSFG